MLWVQDLFCDRMDLTMFVCVWNNGNTISLKNRPIFLGKLQLLDSERSRIFSFSATFQKKSCRGAGGNFKRNIMCRNFFDVRSVYLFTFFRISRTCRHRTKHSELFLTFRYFLFHNKHMFIIIIFILRSVIKQYRE